MASTDQINQAFKNVGKTPTASDYQFYSSYPDAGKVEGDLRAGGNGASNYNVVTPADYSTLNTQITNTINPYYQQLATQAKGDFNTAVQMMTADYQQGTKQAKETLAYQQKYGTQDLNNNLAQLGLTFNGENDKQIDTLNSRGAAVYQNNPNGTPNVVTSATYNPSYNINDYSYSGGVSGANPNMNNLGRGGYEMDQLRQDQSLRAEATARAGMKPLEQAGLSYTQYTNPNSGFDINNPAASTQGADLSNLGTAELGALKSYNTNTQNYRDTSQNLANQETQDVNNLTNQYASLGTKSLDSNMTNNLQKQYTTNFVQGGV